MEVASDVEVLELLNPPQPPTHRLPSTCDRHPNENFTGFCGSCLRERLAGLESTTSTTHRNSTSTISSSIKSIFFRPQGHPSSSSFSSLQPELRRCKSFSCGRADGAPPRISTSFEPQRKSCDVRGRNTLWSLFHQDDNGRATVHLPPSTSSAAASLPVAVIEEEHYEDADEIRPVDPVLLETSRCEINNVGFGIGIGERKVDEVEVVVTDLKPMKDHIDLESQPKKAPTKDFKEIAGSFWLAASVFSKKLQKWRRKQKLKKMKKEQEEEEEERKPGPKSSSSRRFRDTQSEIIAFGRRSCDTDPRFSLDAGRISFDDPRYSLDEPRASWDGYLIGAGTGTGCRIHRHLPPMLSVVEDVQRSDGHIPVEEDLMTVPGGTAQTKDYYSDSSSASRSRRRSLDRSNSIRKSISVEMNHQKLPAVRVSPVANANEDFVFRREWSSNSLRSDRSESFDSHKLPPRSKSKRWSRAWSIWGFIHRRSSSRGGVSSNVAVDRSFSESWPGLRTNGKTLQSNSSVGSRSSQYGNASFGSTRRGNGIEKKRKEEFVLERNPSARYSPKTHVDNGMLKFYLTPMRSSSRRGLGKNVQHDSSYQSFARSVLRLY